MTSDKPEPNPKPNKDQQIVSERLYFSANRLLKESGIPLTSENLTNILQSINIEPDIKQVEQYIAKQEKLKSTAQKTSQPLEIKTETEDGLTLSVTENENGGYSIYLQENLKANDPQRCDKLEYLINSINAITPIKKREDKYLPQEKGGAIRLVTLKVSELEKPTNAKERLNQEIQLYRNLQKVQNSSPKSSHNNIEFYTHLENDHIYRKARKFLELANGLRELYGLIEINSRITRSEIISSKRPVEICEQRRIAMFVLKHKYGLSYPDIGKVLGGKGSPKNHAGIISNLNETHFDMANFDQKKYASLDIPEAYQEAKIRQKK